MIRFATKIIGRGLLWLRELSKIKSIKFGQLPDFSEKGELIEISEDLTKEEETTKYAITNLLLKLEFLLKQNSYHL